MTQKSIQKTRSLAGKCRWEIENISSCSEAGGHPVVILDNKERQRGVFNQR